MDRRRELKKQYLETKPDMGVYGIMQGNTAYICASNNLRGAINRTEFDFSMRGFRHKDIQAAYDAVKGEGFRIEVLDTLPYEKDSEKTDYSEDLAEFCEIIAEELRAEGKEVRIFT